jgi:hypothetical protein
MTTVNENITSALTKKLATLSPPMDIAWENVKFDPTVGHPYLRAWHLPGQTFPLTLGPQGLDAFVGLLQVDCLYPIEKGWYDAKAKAGTICTLFKKGTLCTYNNITVRIVRSWPDPGTIDGDYYKVSTNIQYECYEIP